MMINFMRPIFPTGLISAIAAFGEAAAGSLSRVLKKTPSNLLAEN
jgi:hypothetical protein